MLSTQHSGCPLRRAPIGLIAIKLSNPNLKLVYGVQYFRSKVLTRFMENFCSKSTKLHIRSVGYSMGLFDGGLHDASCGSICRNIMAHATGATSQAETIAIIPIFQLLHWAQKKRISSRDPPESTKTTWRKRAALLNLPTPNRSSSDFRWKSFAWVLVGPASAEEHWTFRCVQGELPRSNFAAPQNQVSKSETKVLEKQKRVLESRFIRIHWFPSPVAFTGQTGLSVCWQCEIFWPMKDATCSTVFQAGTASLHGYESAKLRPANFQFLILFKILFSS